MYTAQNRYGLDDQSLWEAGDTHQRVAQRALAVHGGTMSPEHRQQLTGIAQGGAYSAPNAAPAPAAGPSGPTLPQNAKDAYTGAATVGSTPGQGTQTNIPGAFQQAMVNKLAPAPVNAQNPAIKGSIDANRLAEQRGFERNRNMLAERAQAGGFSDSGALDSLLLGLGQERSGREAAFEGQQLGQLQRQQDDDVMRALALAGGGLGQLQGFDLQRTLADLDAALRREGLGVQRDLGNRDIALRDKLGSGQLNLGLLGLLSGNDQFSKSLSAQLGMRDADRDAAFWGGLF